MTSRRKFNRLEVPDFVLQDEPSCAQTDPELFFPQEKETWDGRMTSKYVDLNAARKICQSCPLKLPCLEYALLNHEIGIWGGTTEEQRKYMKNKNKIKTIRRLPSPEVW